MRKILFFLLLISSVCFGQDDGKYGVRLPPPIGTQINSEHPLAIEMFAGWHLNGTSGAKIWDIVRHTKHDEDAAGDWENATDPVMELTQYGRLPKFPGAAADERYVLNAVTTQTGALDVPDATLGLTVVAFVRCDDVNERRIISHASSTSEDGHAYMLGNIGTLAWRARVNTGASGNTVVTANNTIVVNSWYLVAVTYDRAEIRLHAIGRATAGEASLTYTTAATAATGDLLTDNSPTYIGGNEGGGTGSPWQGFIRWLYLYNRTLSIDELYQLYYDPYQMFEQNPILAHRLFPAEPSTTRRRNIIIL